MADSRRDRGSERVAAESAAIRGAAGLEPLPESATVAVWRDQPANGNGSARPDVRKIIASIEKLRASLPADSPGRAALMKPSRRSVR